MKVTRTLSLALILCLGVSLPMAANDAIKMEQGSWSDVLAKAKAENKPIYLDCYASWCGPCKVLKKEVFTDSKVADYYNDNFVNYALDMEKGEGIELAKRFKVKSYPTHLFFDQNGMLVHRALGGGKGEEFVAKFIDWGKDAQNPDKQYYTMKNRYTNSGHNPEFLYDFALATANAEFWNTEHVGREYFRTQREDELTSEKNWKAMQKLVTSVESREFQYVANNKEKFEKLFGASEVQDFMLRVSMQTAYTSKKQLKASENVFKDARTALNVDTPPEERERFSKRYMSFCEITGDWEGYVDVAQELIDSKKVKDWNMLNQICWNMYLHIDDPNQLSLAEKWIKKSMELDENYYNVDTYASLLLKLGKKEDGIKAAQKAIEIAKASDMDYEATEKLLQDLHSIQ